MTTRLLLISFLILNVTYGLSQTVLNGDFSAAGANWGCAPEAHNPESIYGGTNTTNRVAEIDNLAGLCQTISGFTIGEPYVLTFDCSRRTNCGPVLQSMDFTIDGGVLSTSVTRNGTPFGFVMESFAFTATATTHTITFAGTSGGTCGLILDNIAIVSTLPAELILFDLICINGNQKNIIWETASEKDVDYFEIESTENFIKYKNIAKIDAAGNSTSLLRYEWPLKNDRSDEVLYYRLKTVDFNGDVQYSDLASSNILCGPSMNLISTIQSLDSKIILTLSDFGSIKIYDSSGKLFYSSTSKSKSFIVSRELFSPGIYYVIAESITSTKQGMAKLPIFR